MRIHSLAPLPFRLLQAYPVTNLRGAALFGSTLSSDSLKGVTHSSLALRLIDLGALVVPVESK